MESLVVGFTDLVGFTALSRGLDDDALREVIERFEEMAHAAISSHGGRLVKMIGDEVMFVVQDPCAAAEIGLRLSDAFSEDESMPPVRVGMAYGQVVPRDSDYLGTTVNMAHRIVAVARRGTVLISDELRRAIESDGRFFVRRTPIRSLKGLGRVRLWALRPAMDPPK